MVVMLLGCLWIGALIVALFVQADELRRCRRDLALCRRALVACRRDRRLGVGPCRRDLVSYRDNHRDYGEAF